MQVIIAKKLYQEYEKQVRALIQKLHLPSGFKNITFDEKENVLSLMSLCQKKIKASLGTDVLPYQTLTSNLKEIGLEPNIEKMNNLKIKIINSLDLQSHPSTIEDKPSAIKM